MTRRPERLILVFLLFLATLGFASINTNIKNKKIDKNMSIVFERGIVSNVISENIIEILVDGQKQRVKLIGIDDLEEEEIEENDEDETEKDNEEDNEISFRQCVIEYLEFILQGKIVYLERDILEKDKYGQLLRYVWIDSPSEINEKEIEEKMLNSILIAKGLPALPETKNIKYARFLIE